MTSAVPKPPAIRPSADVDADGRFAAYLADVAAHADDPQSGEDYRAILNDDPQTQRALFDLGEALAMTPAPPPLSTLWTAVAMLVFAGALVVFVAGYFS